MRDSKALKDFKDEKESSKLYLWWIDTIVYKKYTNFVWKFIKKPIHIFKKTLDWYWNVFRNDYDFDAHSIFAILEYKLKRVEKNLLKGYAIQESKDMKALRLAIKLAGRLKDDQYDTVQWERHGKKWGKLKTWFTKCKDKPGYSTWHSSRPKANTPKKKKQERKEHLEGMHAAEAKEKREAKWLYAILLNYLIKWWD